MITVQEEILRRIEQAVARSGTEAAQLECVVGYEDDHTAGNVYVRGVRTDQTQFAIRFEFGASFCRITLCGAPFDTLVDRSGSDYAVYDEEFAPFGGGDLPGKPQVFFRHLNYLDDERVGLMLDLVAGAAAASGGDGDA